MSRQSLRRRAPRVSSFLPAEQLEIRRLLSKAAFAPIQVGPVQRIVDFTNPLGANVIELAPETIDPKTGISPPSNRRVADPADIVWLNRANTTTGGAGDTDGFGATFGTLAPTARAVIDALIVAYERMIGSFDYPSAGQTYSLTLSMETSGGFGASASLGTSFGGKPKSGSIAIFEGDNPSSTNTDHGWFLDPTPFDHSEFSGNITNAFSGDAQGGSPASGKGDFYTVAAAEMTHCMGLFGNALSGWANRTSNTGFNDTVTGVGQYWVFQGPSIDHLGTSDNAGSQNFFSYIHSAEGASNINFGGKFWRGAEDQGNAFYEFSRRYQVNNTFALMFKDAYGYISNNPDQWGTTYSIYNETTDVVTVRGGDFSSGHSPSNDVISVTRNGNIVTVSVNAGSDVGGTGAFSGDQDLPAFVTQYDLTTQPITSLTIDAGAGNDSITIGMGLGFPVTVQGGSGTDSLTILGTSAAETITVNPTTIVSGSTTVTVSGGIESLTVDGGASSDTIELLSNLTGTTATTVINSAGLDVVNVNTDNLGTATAIFNSTMNLTSLNIGAGGLTNMTANGNRVLVTNTLSINATGKLDMFDNDMIVDYTGGSQLSAVQALINQGRSGGTWAGNGITSTSAKTASPTNKTLGAIEATQYKSVYGPAAQFDGQTIDNSAVLVKFTYYGDTDFNGVVNFDDYARTDTGFSANRTGWFNGDFDGNGVVNFDDYSLIDLAFNTQTGPV